MAVSSSPLYDKSFAIAHHNADKEYPHSQPAVVSSLPPIQLHTRKTDSTPSSSPHLVVEMSKSFLNTGRTLSSP